MRCMLTLAFLFCALQNAAALHKASAQDCSDIESAISKKTAAEDEIKNQNIALKEAKGDAALELEIKSKIAELKIKQKNAAEQAIWLTMRAYDIIRFEDNEPILPKGYSFLDSPEKKKRIKITGLPIFEDNGRKELQDANGDPAKFRIVDNRIAGNTASDGISRIFPSAFDSPVELASYIIHEKRHFKQITTKGVGDKMTTAESEVEAYEEEQRLLIDDVLGYPKKIAEAQEKRLIAALFGEKGKKGQPDIKGKRELAREERARADLSNGGRPFPERSIVSLPEDEIQRLIQQAKSQIVIAQDDHDRRLRDSVAVLAVQSCNSPGTVIQQDLDDLPLPHDRGYKQNLPFPADLDSCASWLYMDIRKGSNVEEIKSRVRSFKPVIVQPAPPLPSPFTPARPLSSIFWPLREFVIGACNGTLQAAHAEHLFGTYAVHFSEDDAAVSLKYIGDRNNCEKALFQKIIEKTRSNYGRFHLTDPWVRGVVAANPPKAVTPPGDAAPPDAVPPGVVPPPEQVHPIIPIPGDPWKPRKVNHDSANK